MNNIDAAIADATPSATRKGGLGTFNGLVPVMSAADMDRESREKADAANNAPVIQGLASHVRKCFSAAKTAKLQVEQRMLDNLRARQGKYDPQTLARIRETGGSEVYMMLSSSKARAATAWIRDTIMGNGDDKPWTIRSTKVPDVPEELHRDAEMKAAEMVQMLQDLLGGPQNVSESQVEEILEMSRNRVRVEMRNEADEGMRLMEDKMEDQLQEGGFSKALYEFSDDISTFPAAIIKGPVIRNKPQLTWKTLDGGSFEPVVENRLSLEWERVSPFNIYPSPGASNVHDGYLIELHELTTTDLNELIGVAGYHDASIREVIKQHGQGGLREWTPILTAKLEAEGKSTIAASDMSSPTIAAIQYWGTVLGKDLLDFGMDPKQVTDATKVYNCEVWVIDNWVIKATLNYDPMGRKPYYKASWEEVPGAFWGNAPLDLIRDCQTICNNAARALANNMAVASGPQVDVNIDRVPADEDVTNLYPWKVWQTRSDPYGSTAPPINFFQPQSNANELMGIYEKFSSLADEVSSIPKYMTGDAAAGGAGRTASGLSMMLQNAGKAIKSVIANIDHNVMTPLLERLYYYNMRYGDDPDLKNTDINVVARGAESLVVREQAQVRRNEFLQICLNSPVVANIVGEEAIAELLRTAAAGLDMDADRIVPPAEVIRARMFQQQQQQLQQMLAKQQGQAVSTPAGTGQQPTGTMAQGGSTLADGTQTTNTFAPKQGG